MVKYLTIENDLGREIESFMLASDPYGELKKGRFILGQYAGIMNWAWCIFQINDQDERIAMWPIHTVTEIIFKEHNKKQTKGE